MKSTAPRQVPSLVTIFFILFLDLLGFGIVIPILPYYSQNFGASAWELGWLMTSYSLMQFLFAPLWGWVSDFRGRKPVLIFSVFGRVVSLLILGLAPSLLWLFIGRICSGICGANISTAYAYITDITTEENRTKGMGIIGVGFGLGFIFGPAIGGLLSPFGFQVPIFFAAALSLLNGIFALFYLREPSLSQAERSNRRPKFSLKNFKIVLENRGTRLAIFLFFLLTFAVTQMEVSFALFLKARYSYSAREAGVLLALMGLVMAFMQGGAVGFLSKKFGEWVLVIAGSLICALGLLGFALASQVWASVIALCVLGLGHGVIHPSLSSLASKGAPTHQRGATMGVFQSAGSMARILGPPCAGHFFDQVSITAPFYVGVFVLLFGFFISFSTVCSVFNLEAVSK